MAAHQQHKTLLTATQPMVYKVSLIVGTDAGSRDKTTGTATYDYTYTGNYGASALAYTINQNSAGLSATSSGQETR